MAGVPGTTPRLSTTSYPREAGAGVRRGAYPLGFLVRCAARWRTPDPSRADVRNPAANPPCGGDPGTVRPPLGEGVPVGLYETRARVESRAAHYMYVTERKAPQAGAVRIPAASARALQAISAWRNRR